MAFVPPTHNPLEDFKREILKHPELSTRVNVLLHCKDLDELKLIWNKIINEKLLKEKELALVSQTASIFRLELPLPIKYNLLEQMGLKKKNGV